MDIEVFGTETDRVAAGGASDLAKKTERIEDQQLTMKVENNVVANL